MSVPYRSPFLNQIHAQMTQQGFAPRTIKAYIRWIHRFILFHDKRHPAGLGVPEIEAFLNHLAVHDKVAPNTQNQAISALLYLYRTFLGLELPAKLKPIRATGSPRIPTVLTPGEVQLLFDHMSGLPLLVARLLYGTGLRINEAITLRVKDLDFSMQSITIHDAKGRKNRVVPLPAVLSAEFLDHLERVTLFLHENVQTEAVSIHFEHADANRGRFYSDCGPKLGHYQQLCHDPKKVHLT